MSLRKKQFLDIIMYTYTKNQVHNISVVDLDAKERPKGA